MMTCRVELDPALEQWVNTINLVCQSQRVNSEGCRIPIKSTWNIELLTGLLSEYDDVKIMDYLQFGWLVVRDPEVVLQMGGQNHKGATLYPECIDDYIAREIELGATIGPFEAIPFRGPVVISPLSTRLKRGGRQENHNGLQLATGCITE